MADDAESLSERVFKRWVRVADAIERCAPQLDDLAAARTIWGRLETGDIKAAAASASRPHRPVKKFFLVPPGWWKQQAALTNLDFWKSGDIDIAIPSGVYGEADRLLGQLRGVRFDPAGMDDLAPARSPRVPTHTGPSAAEFQRWIVPAEALTLLPEDWGRGHGVDAIKVNLRLGGIRAAAQRGLIQIDGERRPVELYPIPPEYWDEDQWVMGPEALWVTGQASFHRGSRMAEQLGIRPEQWIEHTFTGVRFDPDDFAREFAGSLTLPASDPGSSELELDLRDKPPLPEALLKKWYELFILAYPDDGPEAGRKSVAGMFPRHHVSREKVRELFPDRGPGRPRKNKDNS